MEPSSMPTLSACNIIRIYSKVEDYEIENKTCVNTAYERKWRQLRLELYLVTESRGRWEIGLPTSSAAVLPLKMMPCMMFWPIHFLWMTNLLNVTMFFCARIDLLLPIFVCSRYRPLLHHFGFVMCVNSRLYCMHFLYHWRKIRNVSHRLMQISKRQRKPWKVIS